MRKYLLIAFIFSLLTAGCAKDFETFRVRFADESESFAENHLWRLFAERVTIDDSDADRVLADGFACYQRKLYGSSRVLIEGHLLEKPSDWRAHYLLALLDIGADDYDGAARCMQTALRFAPPEAGQRAIIYLGLGQALERNGQPALSKQHYLTALNLDSTMVAARDGIDRLTPLSSVEP